jgi:signal transduction histidine kinase
MREKQNSEDRSQDSGGFSPTLTARTKVVGDCVQIEIEDNGPGISEEMKDKIFQPFFTTKKGTEGTGLGLSITNDIIKAHGGELEVRSEPGEGTTFSINIQQNK